MKVIRSERSRFTRDYGVTISMILLILASSVTLRAQTERRVRWRECLSQPAAWYSTGEAVRIADNLLLYQYPSGGWPKNIDMAKELSAREKTQLRAENLFDSSTIDNSTTYTQLRYLAKVYASTMLERFKEPFLKGFDYLLKAQYPNGGWPQFYPLREGYYSHITFNDDAMIGVMAFLRDVSGGGSDFSFVDPARKIKAKAAVNKGIDCILKCQVRVAGRLTAWCAQHDEHDFSPAKARTYELPSLSGAECVGIIEFLMAIEKPSHEIIQSVESAVTWFEKVKIKGLSVAVVRDTLGPAGWNKVVVVNPTAPPMWARFYQIGTNKPFFCSRDGIPRDSLSQISYERRNHYEWLGYWPQTLLTKDYPAWAGRQGLKSVLN